MKSLYRIALLGMAAVAVSCSDSSSKWHINGSVEGLAEGDAVVLEGNNQGYWYVIDTIRTSKDGSFKYAGAEHGYPDIFRLRVGQNSVYFPIDSLETVTINATAPDLAANHTLSGSPQAENLARVDSILMSAASRMGVSAMVNDTDLKQELARIILSDPSGVVSYYIISKTIGDTPLFNPANPVDNRIIGAVANAYNMNRPEDPRTKYLAQLFLSNRRTNSQPSQLTNIENQFEANVIRAFEIDLYDQTGKRHSLLELTDKGNPVILNFTAYGTEWSPAFNIELNKVYSKYHPQGLEIYQVSLDTDEYNWKQAAKNLPWITVLNNVADGGRILRDYNVNTLPTTFVFNRDGQLVERVVDITKLDAAVAKVI